MKRRRKLYAMTEKTLTYYDKNQALRTGVVVEITPTKAVVFCNGHNVRVEINPFIPKPRQWSSPKLIKEMQKKYDVDSKTCKKLQKQMAKTDVVI